MMRVLLTTVSLCVLLFCLRCDVLGGGGGSTVTNYSKITSQTLNTSEATNCSGTVSSCTPSNLKGRVFAAGAMLGGNGGGGYNMTFLANSDDIIQDPSKESHPEGTLSFNLGTPTIFSGKISIPSESSMPASPTISRVETYFDYIDATFTLSGTAAVDGSFTVRTVFRKSATATDITSGETMKIGDKMIKTSSDTVFRWCTSTNCANATRPTSPLQDANVLNIDAINDEQSGNKNYALYSIDLKETLTVTHSQIADITRLWTLNYDVSKAIGFAALPSTFSTEKDIVTHFRLEFGCSFSGCTNSDNRIKATLTIGEAGSAS